MSIMAFNEDLGRKVRAESWSGLKVSTYRRIVESLGQGSKGDSFDLIDYFLDEALVCRRLLDQWIVDTQKFLLFKGYGEARLVDLNLEVNRVIDMDQQRGCWDRNAGWVEFTDLHGALRRAVEKGQTVDVIKSLLVDMKEVWRIAHDLDVDYLLGLYNAVMGEYGEDAIREMYEDHTLKDWFEKRYSRFDVSKHDWEDTHPLLTFLSFEAMHGHLCGEGREGDVEYEDFEDRIELQFDPCGSGGRAYRGEPLEGTGPRMEAPYRYKVIEGAHDFTWNKTGVCTYCAHCCILTEKMPAEKFGYPVRIVEPPTYPDGKNAKCKYIIYKNPRDIPARYYHRVGLEKPARHQPLGSDHFPYKVKE